MSVGSWKRAPGQGAVPACVLLLPQIEAAWDGDGVVSVHFFSVTLMVASTHWFDTSLLLPWKHCLSLFLFLDLWSMWHGTAKTCPSLRRATRCIPGWWWLCWTRTESGKRWVSCVLNAGEGWEPGKSRARITSFPKSLPIEPLHVPSHAAAFATRQPNSVRCNVCTPRVHCRVSNLRRKDPWRT